MHRNDRFLMTEGSRTQDLGFSQGADLLVGIQARGKGGLA
jgi:hypothetical protein